MQNRPKIQLKSFAGSGGMKIAAAVTTVMTLAVLILRVVLTPRMQDVETGSFHLSYIIIAVMTLTLIAVAILAWRSPGTPVSPGGKLLMPCALLAMLTGAVMTITSALDGYNWMFRNRTPPPNDVIISTIDAVTLFFTILFGLLGGVMLVRVGLLWIAENRSLSGVLQWWALAPVGWIWMRLARYEVSYASAVDVSQSFYDFVMLIFVLLFFFAFARYVSGVGQKKPRLLFFFSLATALCCLSGPLTRLILFMNGQYDAYNASRLASPTDGLVGAFALLFAFGLAFGKRAAPGEAAPDTAGDEAAPSVDDILQQIYPKDE